jgi:hypothetical protein
MERLLKEQQIYCNIDLQEFILALETKYPSIEDSMKYSSLVNFSDNVDVPFHKWFRYREGFAGRLIEELIKMSDVKKDEMIIDPFCGSGTTPVVAAMNGYSGFGVDVNPLSAFVSNVKMREYSADKIKKAEQLLEGIPQEIKINKSMYSDVKKYFEENNFNSLCRIKNYIDVIDDEIVKDLYLTAFICIVEACSNRWRDGNGLKTVKTKISDVNTVFAKKFLEIINDIKSSKAKIGGKGLCVADTANNLYDLYLNVSQNGEMKAGTIIFSPPYPNSFDYFESYKLELIFADFAKNITDIGRLRQQAVRSFISVRQQKESDNYISMIAEEIEKAIPVKEAETGKKDIRTRKVPNMIKGYFCDMQEIIRQCGLCLGKGKKVYIVVDQSAYVGVIVPTDLLLAYLAEAVGFEVGKIIECRKARTSAQQLKRYPYLKDTLRESIVELIKK